jgi:hypothetical protein
LPDVEQPVETRMIAEMYFSLLGGVLLAVTLAVTASLAAYLSYRRTVPPLPRGRRVLLTLLRTTSLLVLAVLLAEPVIRFVERQTGEPVIAVLLDDTQSMRLSGPDSLGALDDFLERAAPASPGGAAVRFYPFAGTLRDPIAPSAGSLGFPGQSTNLSGVFSGLAKRAREENIRAVVLVSDGNYNEGRNPLNELDRLALPVFTVGVGDTVRRRDILVDRVYTNTLAYAGSNVPVEVVLRSFGYDGRRVEVTLSEGRETVGKNVIDLSGGKTEYPVRFSIPAGSEGMHKYVVSVGGLPGELTRENNLQTFFIRVLKSKIRVVMFAGAPSPDVAALRQAIAADPQLEIREFVQKSAGSYVGGPPPPGVVDSADCLVFVNFPSALTSAQTITELSAVMEKDRKPLLYVHGKAVDARKLAAFDSRLPFSVSAPRPAEDLVFASVPERMKSHPLVSTENGDVTPESWERLPPIFKMRSTFTARPGSEVLAFARIQTVTLAEPLVLTRNVRGAKSFAVTGHSVYRWRLMAQGSAPTENFFPVLVSNAVRWLTTRENEKPVKVEPLKEIFTTADPLGFRAEVYDDQLRPVENAEVNVEFTGPSGTGTVRLEPLGSGRYEGSSPATPAGDYSWRATAKLGDRDLGTDNGRFAVGPVNVEYLVTTMNRQLLEQLAEQSGGSFYPVNRTDSLWDAIALRADLMPVEKVTRREIELWNWPLLGALLVLLLGVEWFFRKRWALL